MNAKNISKTRKIDDVKSGTTVSTNLNDAFQLPAILHNQIKIVRTNDSCFKEYSILGSLGKGTYAQVWKVKHKTSNEIYAAKLLQPSQFPKESFNRIVEMFTKEIINLSICQCPGVVKLHKVIGGKEGWVLIQDYVNDGTLWKENLTNTIEDSFLYFIQLFQGMCYIQDMNIVHRDLKPTNILKQDNKKIVIADFGWSEHVDSCNLHPSEWPGTLEINPPEVLRNTGPMTEKIDNYALGMNMILFVSGRFVCRQKGVECSKVAQTLLKTVHNLRHSKPPSKFRDNLKAWDLFVKLTSSNPSERISLEKVLYHPWVTEMLNKLSIQNSKFIWHEKVKSRWIYLLSNKWSFFKSMPTPSHKNSKTNEEKVEDTQRRNKNNAIDNAITTNKTNPNDSQIIQDAYTIANYNKKTKNIIVENDKVKDNEIVFNMAKNKINGCSMRKNDGVQNKKEVEQANKKIDNIENTSKNIFLHKNEKLTRKEKTETTNDGKEKVLSITEKINKNETNVSSDEEEDEDEDEEEEEDEDEEDEDEEEEEEEEEEKEEEEGKMCIDDKKNSYKKESSKTYNFNDIKEINQLLQKNITINEAMKVKNGPSKTDNTFMNFVETKNLNISKNLIKNDLIEKINKIAETTSSDKSRKNEERHIISDAAKNKDCIKFLTRNYQISKMNAEQLKDVSVFLENAKKLKSEKNARTDASEIKGNKTSINEEAIQNSKFKINIKGVYPTLNFKNSLEKLDKHLKEEMEIFHKKTETNKENLFSCQREHAAINEKNNCSSDIDEEGYENIIEKCLKKTNEKTFAQLSTEFNNHCFTKSKVLSSTLNSNASSDAGNSIIDNFVNNTKQQKNGYFNLSKENTSTENKNQHNFVSPNEVLYKTNIDKNKFSEARVNDNSDKKVKWESNKKSDFLVKFPKFDQVSVDSAKTNNNERNKEETKNNKYVNNQAESETVINGNEKNENSFFNTKGKNKYEEFLLEDLNEKMLKKNIYETSSNEKVKQMIKNEKHMLQQQLINNPHYQKLMAGYKEESSSSILNKFKNQKYKTNTCVNNNQINNSSNGSGNNKSNVYQYMNSQISNVNNYTTSTLYLNENSKEHMGKTSSASTFECSDFDAHYSSNRVSRII